MIQLLSQYGLSDNVYDKDGQTPLDFQERAVSEELQEVIRINREKLFGKVDEPNPWSWKVWTRIQSEKDTLKQLISYSNPFVAFNIHRGGHGHGHSHGGHHSHSHSSHSHGHHHGQTSNSDKECEDSGNENANDLENEQCAIL